MPSEIIGGVSRPRIKDSASLARRSSPSLDTRYVTSKLNEIERDDPRWFEVVDVRTGSKCLMRQTDNSDNSAGDRIENSATEII